MPWREPTSNNDPWKSRDDVLQERYDARNTKSRWINPFMIGVLVGLVPAGVLVLTKLQECNAL